MPLIRPLLLAALVAIAACGDSAEPPTTAPPPVTTPAELRVVSLSATHTEILYGIGAGPMVVGTDLTSNHPAAAEATAKVDAFNFNVEEVAALDPDLVILAFDFSGEVAALSSLGIGTLYLPPPATLEGAYDQVSAVGAAVGLPGPATELRGSMEDAIAAALASVGDAAAGITVFHEIDNTLYTANSATFIGDLYGRFGLVNIADEVPDEFASGYVQMSPETVLAEDPDFIFLGDAAFGETVASVAARPGWDSLSAVAGGRVVELDSDIAGRWGPRTVTLVEAIAAALLEGGR